MSTRSLHRFRYIIFFGLAIGMLRFGLDIFLPEYAKYVSLYLMVPLAIAAAGFKGTFDDLGFKALPMVFVCGFIIWFGSGSVAYTTGELCGWEFGRYKHPMSEAQLIDELNRRNDGVPLSERVTKNKIRKEDEATARVRFPRREGVINHILDGLLISFVSSLSGAIWCLLIGGLFIGLPAHLRTRPHS